MSFESLLGDLQKLHEQAQPSGKAMNKSLAADGVDDDKKVQAAAEEAGAVSPEAGAEGAEGAEGAAAEGDAAAGAEGGAAGDDDGAGEAGEGEGEPMGKSMTVFDGEGEPMEVVDGTELVKSLMAQVASTDANVQKAVGMTIDLVKSQAAQLAEQAAALGEAKTALAAQSEAFASQGELIKSLQEQVSALANSGRGRASTLTVAEKPAPQELAKSEPSGVSPVEFLAKAESAMHAGRISGRDLMMAESYLNKGLAVPADIVQRVFQ